MQEQRMYTTTVFLIIFVVCLYVTGPPINGFFAVLILVTLGFHVGHIWKDLKNYKR